MTHKCSLCNGKGWITKNGKKVRCSGQQQSVPPKSNIKPYATVHTTVPQATHTITTASQKFAALTTTKSDKLNLDTAQALWEIFDTTTADPVQKADMLDNITAQLEEKDAQAFLDNNLTPYFDEQHKNNINKLYLASQTWTPPGLLALLSRNGTTKIIPEILNAIAQNPNTDPQTLKSITDNAIKTNTENVLYALMHNPKLPPEIVKQLLGEYLNL